MDKVVFAAVYAMGLFASLILLAFGVVLLVAAWVARFMILWPLTCASDAIERWTRSLAIKMTAGSIARSLNSSASKLLSGSTNKE